MSMLVSFVLSFFPRDVLDEILNLIGSVSEGFPSYSRGETTRPNFRGETTRGETTRGEMVWGRNVLLPSCPTKDRKGLMPPKRTEKNIQAYS